MNGFLALGGALRVDQAVVTGLSCLVVLSAPTL